MINLLFDDYFFIVLEGIVQAVNPVNCSNEWYGKIYIHECNGGINVMGVANYFLTRLTP